MTANVERSTPSGGSSAGSVAQASDGHTASSSPAASPGVSPGRSENPSSPGGPQRFASSRPLLESELPHEHQVGDEHPTRQPELRDDQPPPRTFVRRLSQHFRHRSKPMRIRKMPFLRKPVNRKECAGQPDLEAGWLAPEAEATEWLSLFYDLVVVAVLTVFSSTHELSSPGSIAVFLSYQSEDSYHRFLKLLQISTFVYIGAASGGWNPGNIQDPDTLGVTGQEASDRISALDSWITVTIALAASRAILAFQYALGAWLGHTAGRDVKGMYIHVAGLGISTSLAIVAAALPATSKALVGVKIALFYSCILVEILCVWFLLSKNLHRLVHTERIAERYGAFTLIILGEGFISLMKAFNKAISGLSTTDTETYGQVVVAIVVIFLLFLFLFGRFSHGEAKSQHRAMSWELIHFPLHFGLLLLLAAITNFVVTLTYVHGSNVVLDLWESTIGSTLDNQPLNTTQLSITRHYLDKLQLSPSFATELDYIRGLVNSSSPEYNPEITALQYLGQIMVATTDSYGIKVTSDMTSHLDDLYAINATTTSNDTDFVHNYDHAQDLVVELIQEPVNEAMSGTLWLFPTAGIVLILCAARSMLWTPYKGLAYWVIHGTQYVGGLILALLGLLDIGGKVVDLSKVNNLEGANPFYHLVAASWALGILAIVYVIIYAVPIAILEVLHKRRGDVLLEEEEDEEEVNQAGQAGHAGTAGQAGVSYRRASVLPEFRPVFQEKQPAKQG